MIEAEMLCFPNNVVNVLAAKLAEIDPDDSFIVKRPIQISDPDQTISVVAVDWSPERSSLEMGQKVNPKEDTLQTYTIAIQGLINDMDEDRAIMRHSAFSTLIRRMIYRDPVLQLALPQLRVEVAGVRESLKNWGVRSQRWLVNRNEDNFVYMSTLEFWFQTENLPIN